MTTFYDRIAQALGEQNIKKRMRQLKSLKTSLEN
jgi:hypothetical protein